MFTTSHNLNCFSLPFAGFLHGRSSKQVPEPFITDPFLCEDFMPVFSLTDSEATDKARTASRPADGHGCIARLPRR